ncbi:MAG: hypothetical protein HN778_00615 [Prolixibacteraceae bacterium]|nr:hypothetical protein [Prolixibacteraceae bacterium]MBT6006748.1 hypothetical protein [Prolixibacteraceae bacterium]MBT6764472.1 hypothetical protein [Prolixibacteraceae bacterium]MBT6999206.1 hypothetical protein [Prolixibacteraceae bacterium]MBT7393311.1 hypothetical protein [Prolixibacteraceae bacterium]
MKYIITIYFFLGFGFSIQSQNSENENIIIQYTGKDKTANINFHDGQMRPAVGTQNYQILRANRSYPETAESTGWTYNHAPMLAYWNGHFFCEYLSTPVGEHSSPGITLLAKSKDGMNWEKPQIAFPIYFTSGLTDEGKLEHRDYHMHQRMGFYLAPNGKLLVMAHYGGNDGDGVGRVVREMYEDFTLGPIYFIRLNDKWEGEVNYPIFKESDDDEFIAACESFMSDKIRRLQWWEEDYKADDAATFYMPYERAKAFCFYTISDSLTIALFKARMMTWTKDGGKTWKKPFRAETLTYGGAKIWGQKLDNDQYALVYNPTDSPNRHPLCVTISNDGLNYNHLAVVHGEVPVKRYWGIEKRPGPQYVRGISEGNGNPPGDDLWVVYSVNKEDIWISRIPVPIKRTVDGPINDDFNKMETGGLVKGWNIYSPKWCPVKLEKGPDGTNTCLMLKDFDPYDYARATRVFSNISKQRISFDLFIESNPESFYIDICSKKGERLIKILINSENIIEVNNDKARNQNSLKLFKGKWHKVSVEFDSLSANYSIGIDNDIVSEGNKFNGEGQPERIEFRTGEYRLDRKITEYKSGDTSKPGWDEPNADVRTEEAIFYIQNFSTELID